MKHVKKYESLTSFKNDVLPFLEKNECENNLLLGILLNFPEGNVPIFMGTIEKNAQISGVFFQTIERQIILSKTKNLVVDEMLEVAQLLHEIYPNVPGLIGEYEYIIKLATALEKLQNMKKEIIMEQGIYNLKELTYKSRFTEQIRLATAQDKELVKQYLFEFGEETTVSISKEKAEESATKFLANNQLYFLEIEGKIVSMCIWSRPTNKNVCISFVYTPKQYRKKGYASDVVAYVTEKMLNSGYESTALYTDLKNPTSNKIYQEIGYKNIMKSVMVYLDK